MSGGHRCRLARSSAAARCCRSTPGELQARALGAKVEAFDPAGRSVVGQTGELVLTAPLPSMPVGFWNDPDGARYRESYFEMYPGVWRHGDWIRITERGSAVIEGRSDSTLNRQGVRFGTSELYGVVERLPEIADSLVIGLELPGGGYWMPLFVVLADGRRAGRRARRPGSTDAIRTALSQRHVPDDDRRGPGGPADADRQEDGGAGQAAAPGSAAGRGRRRRLPTADPTVARAVVVVRRATRRGSPTRTRRGQARSARRGGYPAGDGQHEPPTLVVAIDGPGSSGKSSVGAAAALEVGYRFCDTGLLYRAVTWLALARRVSASYPHAMRGLVDEVELAPDGEGRLARVLVDGVDHTDDVRRPGGRCRRLRGLGDPGAAPRAARAAAPARRRWRHRDGRPRHRDGRAARRGSQDLPRGVGRGAGPPPDRGARHRPERRRRRERILEGLRRRDELDSTRAVAPLRAAADARIISTDGNRFEDTVDAVVNAIRDAEARRAAETEPSGASA